MNPNVRLPLDDWYMKEDQYPHAHLGTAMGTGAVLLWSMSSACIVFTGRRLGIWQFLAVTSSIGGLLQIAGYLAMRRSLRSILMPPPKIWLAMALGFLRIHAMGDGPASCVRHHLGAAWIGHPGTVDRMPDWAVCGDIRSSRQRHAGGRFNRGIRHDRRFCGFGQDVIGQADAAERVNATNPAANYSILRGRERPRHSHASPCRRACRRRDRRQGHLISQGPGADSGQRRPHLLKN